MMRKADVKVDRLYAADGPGKSYRCARRVKVRVVGTGVVITRGRATVTGSRVRLEEEALEGGPGFAGPTRHPPGEEYTLENKRISHPWTDADDEQRIELARRAEAKAALRARLLAMGLPEHVDYYRRQGRPKDAEEDIEGFDIEPGRVVVDLPVFVSWLERIDPVKIAGDAIDEYVRTEGTGTVFSHAKNAVLAEIAEGIAVTDAELTPDG